MTKITKTLLGATAFIALAAGPALAQHGYGSDQIVVDQVQLGNVWADLNVSVPKSDGDTIGTVLGVGNSATVTEDHGSLSVLSQQTNKGRVETASAVSVDWTAGDVISSTNSTGNASFVAAHGGSVTEGDIIQDNRGDIHAVSTTDVGDTWAVSSSTSAVANASQIESGYGPSQTFREQSSNGNVYADGIVTTEYATGFVQNTTIAAQNSADAHIDFSDKAFLGGIQTTEAGTKTVSTAQTDVTFAEDVITTSAASGNQFNATAIDSKASVGTKGSEVFQGNGSTVFASSQTNVGSFTGAASSTATGVGNGLQFDSIGGYNETNTIQNNFGDVGTVARLNTGDFQSGGIGIVSATSIGNSVASVNEGGFVGGSAIQTNSANIFSRAQVTTGRAGTVAGTSTAIGNSATFNNRSDNNGR